MGMDGNWLACLGFLCGDDAPAWCLSFVITHSEAMTEACVTSTFRLSSSSSAPGLFLNSPLPLGPLQQEGCDSAQVLSSDSSTVFLSLLIWFGGEG